MELALIVWFISTLPGITVFIGFSAVVFLFIMVIMLTRNIDYDAGISNWWFVFVGSCSIVAMLVAIILPTQKTAYAMAAAYTAQVIYENPKVQQLSEKAIAVIEQKLDEHLKK